jgi:hypothetical protein
MALGTDFNPNLFLGGTGGKSVSAGTDHSGLYIIRMNAFLHLSSLLNPGTIIPDERPQDNEKQKSKENKGARSTLLTLQKKTKGSGLHF